LNNEAVAPARHSFDVQRLIGRVAKGLAQLVYGGVDVGVVVDVGVRRPEAHAQLFACDNFALLFDERE